MKITIVTAWCNEELFAPFFLAHYSYVDRIYVFLDTETNDNTESICRQCRKVIIKRITYPKKNGFSSKYKLEILNPFIRRLRGDWVYFLDADEFIFPRKAESARVVLARQSANLLTARMWDSWRHKTETDLNPSMPSVYQRRHGSLERSKHMRMMRKPIIARLDTGIQWYPGGHREKDEKGLIIKSEETFIGSHWKNADVMRMVAKETQIRERVYREENVNHKSIKREIKKRAEEHLDDSRMF